MTTVGDALVTAKSFASPLTAAVCQWGTLALVRIAQVLHPVPREVVATATMMSSTERQHHRLVPLHCILRQSSGGFARLRCTRILAEMALNHAL